MIDLFGRKFELVLTDEDGEARDYSDLSVKFEINRLRGAKLNTARVTIYNLRRETASLLSKGGQRIRMSGGYESRFGLLFEGVVSTSFTTQEGANRITEIFARDELKDWEKSIVSLSFDEGATLHQVVNGVLASFSNTRAPDLSPLEDQTLSGSQHFTGRAEDFMNEIGRSYGFIWSVQSNGLEIVRRGESNGKTPVDITRDTGMIGSPTTRQEQLVEVKSLLHPGIIPSGRIRIETAGAIVQAETGVSFTQDATKIVDDVNKGVFFCHAVIHTGETRGQSWYTTAIAQRALEVA